MRFSYTFCILTLLAFFGQPCTGQFFKAKEYHTGQGLPSEAVYHLTQDAMGKMWFLTQRGICVYDGVDYVAYPSDEDFPITLESNLKALPDGSVWVFGMNQGGSLTLKYYLKGKWNSVPLPENFPWSLEVGYWADFRLLPNGNYQVVISLKRKLYVFDFGTQAWKTYDIPLLNEGFIHKLHFAGNRVYLISKQKIFLFENELISEIEIHDPFKGKGYRDFLPLKSGGYFLLGFKEAGIFRNGDWIYRHKARFFTRALTNRAGEIIEINERNILFNYGNTPHLLELTRLNEYLITSNNLREDRRINRSYVDRQNNVWVATSRGVYKFSDLSFLSYTKGLGLQEDEATSIARLGKEQVFVGSNQGFHVFGRSGQQYVPFPTKKGFDITRVGDVQTLPDSSVLFSAYDYGLWQLFPSGALRKRAKGSIGTAYQYDCYLLYNRMKEHSNWRADFVIEKNGKSRLLPEVGFIRKFSPRKEGGLWLNGIDMLCSFDPHGADTVSCFQSNHQAFNNYAALHYQGKTLIGSTIGLKEFKDGKIISLELHGKEIERPVFALLVDSNNCLWVGTDQGVFVCNPSERRWIHYRETNGLIGNEINRAALAEITPGEIWIGTNKGLSVFKGQILPKETIPLKPYLRYIETNKAGLSSPLEPMYLDYDDNNLTFGFAVAFYHEEENLKYRYKLNAFDKEWNYISNPRQNTIKYTSLPPGEYQLEIQATEGDESWSKSAHSFTVNIKVPYYQTYWFRGIASLLLIGLIYTISVMLNQKRNEKLLKRKVDEKMAESLAYQKGLIEKNNELLKTNKELDRFVYSVSHDLRSPVASSIGLIEIIEQTDDLAQKAVYLQYIQSSLLRMDDFIQDILHFSRNSRTALEINQVSFKKIIDAIFEDAKYQEGVTIPAFSIEIEEDGSFRSDPRRIQVVLHNLIRNSIKYQHPSRETPYVNVKGTVSEQEAVISIEDNGLGIEEKHLAHIFDMFYRANDVKPGSGVGLYIVKETLEKLNGSVSVISKVNVGSTFTLTMPNLAETEAHPSDKTPA